VSLLPQAIKRLATPLTVLTGAELKMAAQAATPGKAREAPYTLLSPTA